MIFSVHVYVPLSEVVRGENMRETPSVVILSSVSTGMPSIVHVALAFAIVEMVLLRV